MVDFLSAFLCETIEKANVWEPQCAWERRKRKEENSAPVPCRMSHERGTQILNSAIFSLCSFFFLDTIFPPTASVWLISIPGRTSPSYLLEFLRYTSPSSFPRFPRVFSARRGFCQSVWTQRPRPVPAMPAPLLSSFYWLPWGPRLTHLLRQRPTCSTRCTITRSFPEHTCAT